MLANDRPGPMGYKNLSLSPAAADLGLGDQLTQQLQDQLAERRKRSLAAAQTPGSPFPGGAAASMLLGI